MNRQPTRTDLVEAHNDQIMELRKQSIDARTMSRAYKDIADSLQELPSKGELWDVAQRDIIATATSAANQAIDISIEKSNKADEMEKKGVDIPHGIL